MNRRDFLGAGASGLAALHLAARTPGTAGANDRVRVAICGLHGRGGDHLENYLQIKNV
ncbi:MAG: gfo/Idh/MocA family oxidoreductase, partial [Acidobacteriaceae bacterium]|nr:gfo/Idh/MocA family oxidoreductase [Acidobacteriaceae bacterium]